MLVKVTSIDHLTKITALTLEIDITVGCSKTAAPFVTEIWTKPGKWTVEFEKSISFNAPVLKVCLDAAESHSDPAYEFTSTDLIADGNLNWISFDKVTKQFIINPTKQEYLDYYGKTITVKFEVYDGSPSATRPRLSASDFEF